MNDTETWDNWRTHVLSELKRSNDSHALIAAAVANLHVELAKLQVKSGIWGVLGGLIPVLILIAIERLK